MQTKNHETQPISFVNKLSHAQSKIYNSVRHFVLNVNRQYIISVYEVSLNQLESSFLQYKML